MTDPVTQDGSAVVATAVEQMRDALHPSVFNHTMRVLHLASHLSRGHRARDDEALAVAVLFHDSGTIEENNGHERFEIEGADAAVRFLDGWDWTPERVKPVWDAIALHTSAGIAERFGSIARVLRRAVLVDLGRADLPGAVPPGLDGHLAAYPRLDIEHVLPELVTAQALEPGKSDKAPPYTWPGALVAQHRAARDEQEVHGHAHR
jgi:hypothetical protein